MTISTFEKFLPLLAAIALSVPPAQADDKPACKYVRLATIPLHYTGPSLEITMDGTINGTPALMLVDTGSDLTALTRTGTEKRGLSLRMTDDRAVGIGGLTRLYATRVNEFVAGPAKTAKGWIQVISDMGAAPAVDAIAGAPFLLQRDLEINLPEKEIRFFQPIDCKEDTYLAYWGTDAIEIPYEWHPGSSPNPHFSVQVNGQKLEAMIDSGSWTTSIDARAATRAGLKLDAPSVVRLGDSVGAGERRVAQWSAVLDTLKIGDETIKNASVAVMDTRGQLSVDLLLGADFLRAHRVLFAKSQRKLYISYVGGEPLGQRTTIEPWIQKEADGGNPDAQMALAAIYAEGRIAPKDSAKAVVWLEKAAQLGHPRANLALGYTLMASRRYKEAATHIRSALDKLPAERIGALMLYLARVHLGDPALGARELEATFARSAERDWPAPIADFYLGRIDAAMLLDAAGKDRKLAKARTCQASSYMALWYTAQGDEARARTVTESQRMQCGAPPAAAPRPAAQG